MAQTLRVMTYNIRHACGADGTVSVDRIAEVVRVQAPDVVSLQEVDAGTRRSGGVDQPAAIAEELGMHCVFGPTMTRDGGQYGNAILSRRRMTLLRNERLPGPDIPGDTEPRGAMMVGLEGGAGTIHVISTHLGLGRWERGEQMKALLGWIGPRTLVCGDLNCTALSRPMRAASRVLRDAQRAVRGWRTRPTWPARIALFRIDHVLVSRDLDVLAAHVPQDRLARTASDHRPLVVTVRGPR